MQNVAGSKLDCVDPNIEAYYSVNVLSYSVDALFLFVSQN